jgi:hypothetical protein
LPGVNAALIPEFPPALKAEPVVVIDATAKRTFPLPKNPSGVHNLSEPLLSPTIPPGKSELASPPDRIEANADEASRAPVVPKVKSLVLVQPLNNAAQFPKSNATL